MLKRGQSRTLERKPIIAMRLADSRSYPSIRQWFAVATIVGAHLAIALGSSRVSAATIASWAGGYQIGGDLARGHGGADGYGATMNWLNANGHQVVPGVSEMTIDSLALLDVFLWGAPRQSITLSSSEQEALAGFVASGGLLLIESDSSIDDRRSANHALAAVGLGRPVVEHGAPTASAGREVGRYTSADRPSLTAQTDLRGGSFGTTQAAYITPTRVDQLEGTTLGGIWARDDEGNEELQHALIAEFQPFSDGLVVYMGDPFFSNRFNEPSGEFYNPSHVLALENLLIGRGRQMPATCDVNQDFRCDAFDIDALSTAVRTNQVESRFDLNADAAIDGSDRAYWIVDLMNSWNGDANLDGEFNSSDLIAVFAAGQYEDSLQSNAGWAAGDWNGDADFDTGDLVVAFEQGGYERGPRASAQAVPEVSSYLDFVLILSTILPVVRGT